MKKIKKNKSNVLTRILGVNMYPNIGMKNKRIDILRRKLQTMRPITTRKRKNKTQKKLKKEVWLAGLQNMFL